MQNIDGDASRPSGRVRYRERLSPSLWALVAAGLVGPMVGLVVAPIGQTLSLVVGAVAGLAVVLLLVAGAPVVEVSDGMLRAGRAQIDLRWVGAMSIATGDDARRARGAGLGPRTWHVVRGGIDPVVIFQITDPDDPTPDWVVSTRTPDRLVAAVEREQRVRRRTPGR